MGPSAPAESILSSGAIHSGGLRSSLQRTVLVLCLVRAQGQTLLVQESRETFPDCGSEVERLEGHQIFMRDVYFALFEKRSPSVALAGLENTV